jgi:DNA-directed RNA polymerase specialized sigma24 family protein
MASPQADVRFTALLDQYGRVLRQAVARFCPKDIGLQVSEIEQEVRIRLWRALQTEKEIREPASYLYRIAATATIDAVRRIKVRRESSLDVSAKDEEAPGSFIHCLRIPTIRPTEYSSRDRQRKK